MQTRAHSGQNDSWHAVPGSRDEIENSVGALEGFSRGHRFDRRPPGATPRWACERTTHATVNEK
ncbi:hypothetical protein HSRCO_0468 [Halanaeroarchaeum sp. HSR-CO]|nr:hypothetical protein HSRCO_0468 [Halanaeroarchaeum sp. HSR-CO]